MGEKNTYCVLLLCLFLSVITPTLQAGHFPKTQVQRHSTAAPSGANQDCKPLPPQNLKVSFDADDGFTATWDPSASHHVDGYEVQWCWGPSCLDNDVVECNDTRIENSTTFHLTDILPLTHYTLSVSASGKARRPECASAVIVQCEKSPRGIPRRVQDLKAAEIRRDAVTIGWLPPKLRKKTPVEYQVQWKVVEGGCVESICSPQGQKEMLNTTFTVMGLQPYTRTCFSVTPYITLNNIRIDGLVESLCVRSLPFDPSISVSDVSSVNITVSWKEQADSSAGYYLRLCTKFGKCDGLDFVGCPETKTVNTSSTEHKIVGLKPWTSVLVQVQPYSTVGIHCFTTNVAPPTPPRDLVVTHINSTSVTLTWKSPASPNGPVHAYLISAILPATQPPNVIEVDGNRMGADVPNLKPWTAYTITVRAVNLNGSHSQLFGERATIAVKTLPGEPSVPRSLTVTTTSRTMTASWTEPESSRGPKGSLKYRARIDEDTPGSAVVVESDIETPELTYNTLDPFTPYTLSVYAYITYKGTVWEGESAIFKFQTDPEAPEGVRNLTADCTSEANVIKLYWTPPIHAHGVIQGYNIVLSGKKKSKEDIHRTVHVGAGEACHSSACSFEIHSVKAEYTYSIGVRAKNKQVVEFGATTHVMGACFVPPGAPSLATRSVIVNGDTSWTANTDRTSQAVFGFWKDTFSDLGGSIVAYDVIVAQDLYIGSRTHCLTWGRVHTHGFISCYVASPAYWNPFSSKYAFNDGMNCTVNCTFVRCTLGAEWDCLNADDRCNGPLKAGLKYGLVLRAYTAAGFRDAAPVFFHTVKHDYTEFNHRIMIAALLVIGIILIVVVTGVLYYSVRRRCFWEARKPPARW